MVNLTQKKFCFEKLSKNNKEKIKLHQHFIPYARLTLVTDLDTKEPNEDFNHRRRYLDPKRFKAQP